MGLVMATWGAAGLPYEEGVRFLMHDLAALLPHIPQRQVHLYRRWLCPSAQFGGKRFDGFCKMLCVNSIHYDMFLRLLHLIQHYLQLYANRSEREHRKE